MSDVQHHPDYRWAMQQQLRPHLKLALLAIAFACRHGNGYPSRADLARLCSMTERSARRYEAELRNAGLLERFEGSAVPA